MSEGGTVRGAARGASASVVGTGRDSREKLREKKAHPTRSPQDSREKAHPTRSETTGDGTGEQSGAPIGWYAQQVEKMLLRNSQAHDSAQRDQLTSQLASRRHSTVCCAHTFTQEKRAAQSGKEHFVRLYLLTGLPLTLFDLTLLDLA